MLFECLDMHSKGSIHMLEFAHVFSQRAGVNTTLWDRKTQRNYSKYEML